MKTIKEKFYDFVVTDFDGTIFNSHGEVSKKTVETIKAFIAKGGTFCVCTGRMSGSIIPFLKTFGLDSGYVIAYNGAEICNIKTGEKIYKSHVDNKTAITMLKYAEENNFDLMVYPNDVITVEAVNELNAHYINLNGTEGQVLGSKVSEYFEKYNFSTGKALFLTGGDEKIADKIVAELPLLVGDSLNVTKSNPYHVDIMKRGVSKGETVKEFAKLMGKSLDKLVCFGDEMNDASMMEVCALSCVPANGNPSLKQICDIVIDACDDDGVSKAIEKYCI